MRINYYTVFLELLPALHVSLYGPSQFAHKSRYTLELGRSVLQLQLEVCYWRGGSTA